MRLLVEWKACRRAALAAAIALALSPAALIARDGPGATPPTISFSFDRISSFTPAGADPRLAASLASRAPTANDFHFTPTAARGRPAQVRVAIRARAVTAAAARNGDVGGGAALTALATSTYNLGVGIGWRRFAVSGDVAKVSAEGSPLGGRESAAVALSYNLKRFTGRVAVDADRGDGTQLAALARKDNVALDLGGAYSLSRSIALTGGVRYKIEHDRLSVAHRSAPRQPGCLHRDRVQVLIAGSVVIVR